VKVVITVPWARRLGGAETMLATFLRSVDREHFQPVPVFFEQGPLADELEALGYRVYVIPAGRLRQPWNVARTVTSLARLLEREQPDLLLNWTTKTQLYGACAALIAGRGDRVVWWQHAVRGHHWLDLYATLLPARAVGCSSLHAAAAQGTIWPRRPVFVVHPGIDAPARSGAEARRRRLEALGIPPERHIVGLVGRIEPGKCHKQFLDVVAALRRRGEGVVHGLLVGGPLPGSSANAMRELQAAVVGRGLDDAVTITGHVPDARELIEVMDVLVSLAPVESFGIALLEAMAFGVPVVAAAAGGPRELIEDGTSGLLVPTAEQNDVADAVQRLLDDASLRERISAGAVDRFRSRFGAERMAADLQRAIAELAT
jgi:glycosyltransferase involved in cell wall biosynthesis